MGRRRVMTVMTLVLGVLLVGLWAASAQGWIGADVRAVSGVTRIPDALSPTPIARCTAKVAGVRCAVHKAPAFRTVGVADGLSRVAVARRLGIDPAKAVPVTGIVCASGPMSAGDTFDVRAQGTRFRYRIATGPAPATGWLYAFDPDADALVCGGAR